MIEEYSSLNYGDQQAIAKFTGYAECKYYDGTSIRDRFYRWHLFNMPMIDSETRANNIIEYRKLSNKMKGYK